MRIAIDIGGVLAPKMGERRLADGTYCTNFEPKEGAFDAVRKLVKKIGAENVFVLSRVSGESKIKVNWDWLRQWEFFHITGVLEQNVIIFDGERKQKAYYVREHGITCMVDDRLEVLVEMNEGIRLVAFCPEQSELDQFAAKLFGRPVMVLRKWLHFETYFDL